MAQWVRSDLFVLAVGMSLFVTTLVAVTMLLSLARQSRTWRAQRSKQRLELASLEGVFAAPKPLPILPRVIVAALPERDLAAERQSWVLHDAAPDHFMIEPENGPTRHERNVQRLIAYLKEEAGKTAAPVS
jgi:hypothetical protein